MWSVVFTWIPDMFITDNSSTYMSLYRHFLYSAFHGEGSLKIPIPLVLRHVPQPNTEQLSPGSLFSIQQTQKTIPVERTTLQSFKNSSGEV